MMKYSLLFVLLVLNVLISRLYSQCDPGPCKVCNVSATITAISGANIINGNSIINGSVNPNAVATGANPLEITASSCGEITLSVMLDFEWDKGDRNNWLHGISFQKSPNWSAGKGVIVPSNSGWIFLDSIVGLCSRRKYSYGYYWDPDGRTCPPSGNRSSFNGSRCTDVITCEATSNFLKDKNPRDNWGIACTDDCPNFGFDLTYCPHSGGTRNEIITFILTEDGETGGWHNSGSCIFSLNFPIVINSAGLQLPEIIGPICQDSCVVLDAGIGCDSYLWSTGDTLSNIEKCLSETTDFSVTVTSETGCRLEGSAKVLVIPCCTANPGLLKLSTNEACSNDTIYFDVTDSNTSNDYSNMLCVSDESGKILQIFMGTSGKYIPKECGKLLLHSYNYLDDGSITLPSLSSNISEINCQSICCTMIQSSFMVVERGSPELINPPNDITLTCIDLLPPMNSLAFTNNCMASGIALGTEDINSLPCSNDTIIRTWKATSICGNTSTHMQTITVDPIQPPSIEDLPAEITVSCNEINNILGQDLYYSNLGEGNCLIKGNISPLTSGSHDVCGGQYIETWEYISDCGFGSIRNQQITVDAAPQATFDSLPNDITISCDDFFNFKAPNLYISNGELGSCKITAIVEPKIIGSPNICGGKLELTWEFSDVCSRITKHTQYITVESSPEITFVDPPTDITISCEDMPQGAPDIKVTNFQQGPCEITKFVSPVKIGTVGRCGGSFVYKWETVSPCGKQIVHEQKITVLPSPKAAFINTPPSQVNVSFENAPTSVPMLKLSNNNIGDCLIETNILPIISGSVTKCGGTQQILWSYVDECERETEFTQTVIIDPTPQGVFKNVPANMTIDCESIPENTFALALSNGQNGIGAIIDTVYPTIEGVFSICGATVTNTWMHTDTCGRLTFASQSITNMPANSPQLDSLPPDITVSCKNVPDDFIPLSYTNGLQGFCGISGIVNVVRTGINNLCEGILTDEWNFTDICNRNFVYSRQINKIEELVVMPNIINVSGGSPNNAFTVYGNLTLKRIVSMKILDRWGNLIFKDQNFLPNDPSLGWHGKLNNMDVLTGVYIYIVEVEMTSGEKKFLTGDITVIK